MEDGGYATLQDAMRAGDREAIRCMMAARDDCLKRKREEEAREEEAKRQKTRDEEPLPPVVCCSDAYWKRLSSVVLEGETVPKLLEWLHRLLHEDKAIGQFFMCLDIELLDGSGDLDLIVKEERRSGFYPDEKEATFVEASLPPLHITPFAIDGAGGYYAFWRRPNEELENAPVIVWDSEGTIGLMAPSLEKYLALLAALNAGKCALHTAIAEESVEFPKQLLGKRAGEEGITDGMYSATFEEAIDAEGRKRFIAALDRDHGIKSEELPYDAVYGYRSQEGLSSFCHYCWLCLE